VIERRHLVERLADAHVLEARVERRQRVVRLAALGAKLPEVVVVSLDDSS
jgi:hypothetical protein